MTNHLNPRQAAVALLRGTVAAMVDLHSAAAGKDRQDIGDALDRLSTALDWLQALAPAGRPGADGAP